MMFGEYKINIDRKSWLKKYKVYSESTEPKISGMYKGNKHYKIAQDDRALLSNIINKLCKRKLNWFFEFFYATEPVGLHNDYLQQYWDEESDTRDVSGVLIPIDWSCKQPYTIFFDKFTDTGKLIYRQGEMRDHKTNEIYHYRDSNVIEKEIDYFHPPRSEFRRQFENLRIDKAYLYQKDTIFIFDTRQWHSSSWFLEDLTVKPYRTEYKLIISGFGALNIYK